MRVIRAGKLPKPTMMLACKNCTCIFEIAKNEAEVTSQMGVMHDGLGSYNIECPTCNKRIYFDWR